MAVSVIGSLIGLGAALFSGLCHCASATQTCWSVEFGECSTKIHIETVIYQIAQDLNVLSSDRLCHANMQPTYGELVNPCWNCPRKSMVFTRAVEGLFLLKKYGLVKLSFMKALKPSRQILRFTAGNQAVLHIERCKFWRHQNWTRFINIVKLNY